jgi:ferredoxin
MVASWRRAGYIPPVPKIVFEASRPERTKEATVTGGGELVDLADELLAAVPFSCRSATCGTCICQVLEGGNLLEEPNEDEAELLELMGSQGDARLCCQARYRDVEGVIRLRALDTGPPAMASEDD